MRKSTASSLLAVLALALVLRLSPLTRFVYFGSDVGEYFRISKGLLETGHIALPYTGWGVTYPYFPGMFFLVTGASLGGLELSGSLDLVVPSLGALIPAVVFLLAVRVLHEDKAGLIAAAFVAVAMPHVFQTAHPIPGTVGELLAVSALLLWLRLPRDPRTWALLLPITLALVATHHLSAYFLIVMLLIGLALRAVVRPAPVAGVRAQVAYLLVLIGISFGFWFGYAATFRSQILTDVRLEPWWLTLAGFPALVALLGVLVLLRQRFAWRYRPRYPSLRHISIGYAVAFGSAFGVVAFAVAFAIAGTTIRLSTEVLWYFLPLFAFFALSGSGRKHTDFAGAGIETTGWFLALVLSMVFGSFFAPRVLIPYRHIEYAVVVLSVFVGSGFARFLELGDVGRRRVLAAGIVAFFVAGSALSAFPSAGLLANYEEGARPAAIDVSSWMGDNVDGLLATDHRASSLAYGFGGVNATWDTAPLALIADDFATAEDDMLLVRAPGGVARVDYVLVDTDLAAGVQLSPLEPARPLSPAALAKFASAPYQKVFDNGFAQVYFVNWGCPQGSCP